VSSWVPPLTENLEELIAAAQRKLKAMTRPGSSLRVRRPHVRGGRRDVLLGHRAFHPIAVNRYVRVASRAAPIASSTALSCAKGSRS